MKHMVIPQQRGPNWVYELRGSENKLSPTETKLSLATIREMSPIVAVVFRPDFYNFLTRRDQTTGAQCCNEVSNFNGVPAYQKNQQESYRVFHDQQELSDYMNT
jgi:hypothetical protein